MEKYEPVMMEVIRFENEDIITQSLTGVWNSNLMGTGIYYEE